MKFDKFYGDYITAQRTSANVNIDTTFRCRLQCPFCMRQRDNAKPKVKSSQDLSYEAYDKVLKFFRRLNFCGQLSDPIYHKNFLRLLEIRKQQCPNHLVTIATNGSGKSMEWWNNAFDLTQRSITNWVFGVDGASQQTHEIYRVNGSFEQSFNAMVEAGRRNMMVEWQFIVFKHNEHEIEKAKKMALDNNICFRLLKSSRYGDHKNARHILPPSPEWVSTEQDSQNIRWRPEKWYHAEHDFTRARTLRSKTH